MVYLVSILMFLRCFLLVFSCFLKFICNGFLEKRMSDEGFWIYVFCMENRIFLKHFLRGLFGVLRQTRRNLGDFGRVFNPLYRGFSTSQETLWYFRKERQKPGKKDAVGIRK